MAHNYNDDEDARETMFARGGKQLTAAERKAVRERASLQSLRMFAQHGKQLTVAERDALRRKA